MTAMINDSEGRLVTLESLLKYLRVHWGRRVLWARFRRPSMADGNKTWRPGLF